MKVTMMLSTAEKMATLLKENSDKVYPLSVDQENMTNLSVESLLKFIDENFNLVTDRITDGIITPVSIDYFRKFLE